MNFVAIDFETASNFRDVCALGLVAVENGEIVSEKEWLIRPRCNFIGSLYQGVHGISYAMVANKPYFDSIYEELKNLLEGKTIIAHNASFDVGVLKNVCAVYGLEHPDFIYGCTYRLAKRVIRPTVPSYSLSALANKYGLILQHHNALSDARACANLMLRFLEESTKSSVTEAYTAYNMKIGQMNIA